MIKDMDFKDMLEKAKDIQQSLLEKKEKAGKEKVDIAVGGGMVQVKMNGNLELLSLQIDDEIVDKNDKETLEDLIRAGVNEAIRQAKKLGSGGINDIISNFNMQDFLSPKKE
jgi:DNA-binding YbaB/EbfC family protein